MNPSSTVDNDVFSAHRLLLTDKLLTKTECLLSKKSSSKPNCTKNHTGNPGLRLTLPSSAHIDYWWLRNRWRKLSPNCTKIHTGNPVIQLRLKSSLYVDYWWLRNCLRKQSPRCPTKSSSKPSSTADTELFIVHRLLLPHKPLTRNRTLGRKNQPRSQVLRLTLTFSGHIDYWWLRNRWRKLSPNCTKNHLGNPILRLTLLLRT
jgi:hypothetical protein